jgi:REP element-mobilizing transposase RayT
MAHSRHVHVLGGIYLVSALGEHGQAVFADDNDRAALGQLLARVIKRCGAQVHAFKWLPDELLMILQVSTVSISAIMQRVGSVHARRVNEKLGYKGNLFQHPHRQALLDDPASTLEAIATVHGEPVSLWSSQRAYLGIEEIPWLTKRTIPITALTRSRCAVGGLCFVDGASAGMDADA